MARPLVTFASEIKQVSSRKLASLDLEYKVTLLTSDPAVMNLGTLAGDQLFNVTIEAQ
jgi:Mg/Co/Ni transporter MgtE